MKTIVKFSTYIQGKPYFYGVGLVLVASFALINDLIFEIEWLGSYPWLALNGGLLIFWIFRCYGPKGSEAKEVN